MNMEIPDAGVVLPAGRSPDRGPDSYLDVARLQYDTGFEPIFDVENAVPDYVGWLRRHDR